MEKQTDNLKKEEARKLKYAAILNRATLLNIMTPEEYRDRMMDIESADLKFSLRLDEWLAADDFNFTHDFYGIRNNINRKNGFPATKFGHFRPRFAGKNLKKFDFYTLFRNDVLTITVKANSEEEAAEIAKKVFRGRILYGGTRELAKKTFKGKELKGENGGAKFIFWW